jgi:hypothetical protein
MGGMDQEPDDTLFGGNLVTGYSHSSASALDHSFSLSSGTLGSVFTAALA